MTAPLVCQDCRSRVAQQEDKALSGETQVVWANLTDGAWVCPATGNEHRPGSLWPWMTEAARLDRLEPDFAAVLEAAQAAIQAADGDSNDDEIEALQGALECAMDSLGLTMPDAYEVEDGD